MAINPPVSIDSIPNPFALAGQLKSNPPVLIGAVPLFTVTNLTLSEGYQIVRVAGSRLAQLVAPTTKTISIDAVLLGPDRRTLKKALEAVALTSRALAAAAAPAMKLAGVPVVSGMTVSLDMQVTTLRFTQSNQKRDAIDVSIALEQVTRSPVTAVVGEALDVALAAGSNAVPTPAGLPAPALPLGAPI